ncbi:ankyrin repeat domain-containing protein 2 isoform X1 [Alosa alosa]|nr:ankyrin repeat domain-containing protein 2 isoform X1 [Alosa alosa]
MRGGVTSEEPTANLSQNPTETTNTHRRDSDQEQGGGEINSVGISKREERRRTRALKLGVLKPDAEDQQRSSPQVEEEQLKTAEGEKLEGAGLVAELRRRRRAKQKAARTPKVAVEAPVEGPVDSIDFLKAAANGKVKMVEKFLQDGGDPNTSNEFRKSALHHAAQEGHTAVIQKLLEHGVDIHLKDRLHSTAVHWACRGGSLAALKLLHFHGANLNARDKLFSAPLHVATRTGHYHVVEYLLNNKVKINSRDREGDTALHDAVRLNRYKISKLLILSGADTRIANIKGLRAMDQLNSWQSDTLETLQRMEQLRDL